MKPKLEAAAARKTKILIVIICALIIIIGCLMPIFINYTAAKSHYNPVASLEDDYLTELLVKSLYPYAYTAELQALPFTKSYTSGYNSGLNYGKYKINFIFGYHQDDSIGYLNFHATMYDNTVFDSGLSAMDRYFKVERSIFSTSAGSASTLWQSLDDDKYYYAYFALENPSTYNSRNWTLLYDQYATKSGEKLVEWIAFTVEGSDRLWGLTTPARPYGPDACLAKNFDLYAIFSECIAYPETVKYLSDLRLFGDNFADTDFAALRENLSNDATKAIGIMMYGKGAQLKEFKDTPGIKLTGCK